MKFLRSWNDHILLTLWNILVQVTGRCPLRSKELWEGLHLQQDRFPLSGKYAGARKRLEHMFYNWSASVDLREETLEYFLPQPNRNDLSRRGVGVRKQQQTHMQFFLLLQESWVCLLAQHLSANWDKMGDQQELRNPCFNLVTSTLLHLLLFSCGFRDSVVFFRTMPWIWKNKPLLTQMLAHNSTYPTPKKLPFPIRIWPILDATGKEGCEKEVLSIQTVKRIVEAARKGFDCEANCLSEAVPEAYMGCFYWFCMDSFDTTQVVHEMIQRPKGQQRNAQLIILAALLCVQKWKQPDCRPASELPSNIFTIVLLKTSGHGHATYSVCSTQLILTMHLSKMPYTSGPVLKYAVTLQTKEL